MKNDLDYSIFLEGSSFQTFFEIDLDLLNEV